jgi:hypothetical protein
MSYHQMSMQEYYEFIESDSPDIFRKLGSFAWLGVAIALVETLIAIKFGKGMFPQPWPTKVLVVWGVVGVALAAVLLVWSFRFYILDKREQQKVGGAAAGVRSTRSQQKKVA